MSLKKLPPSHSKTNLRKYVQALCYFTLLSNAAPLFATPTTYVVNSTGDSAAGSGTSGTLRYCINQANNNPGPNVILFSLGGTINLTQSLPPINSNIASILSNGNAVVINGGSLFQPFFVQTGTTLTLGSNISVTNGASIGGAGGAAEGGGGGGALGAGGGLFVAPGANVTVQGVSFNSCKAVGGNGGPSTQSVTVFGGGGGGGMSGGIGGSALTVFSGGGGGGYGGIGGAAGASGGGGGGGLFFPGGAGNGGGGGGGSDTQPGVIGGFTGAGNGGAGGSGSTGTGGTGGIAGTTGGAGGSVSSPSNGGGGGGGASTAANPGGAGGNSPLGAGGGGASNGAAGGAGGGSTGSFGGGGGAGSSSVGITVGSQGGNGGFAGGGGGGASYGMGTAGPGGNGGFGGGGGGTFIGTQAGFGNGGFGAGGGGGYTVGTSGQGGFGGGAGGAGGGGGGALGGTVFVGSGSVLALLDPLQSSISSGASTGGSATQAGNPGQPLGPDIFLMSSGTIVFSQSTMFTINTMIASDQGAGSGSTATGGITMSGSGTLVLGGANTYTGLTTFNAGTVQISSNNNLGAVGLSNLVFNGGTLAMTAAVISARNVTLTGNGKFITSPGVSTWSGVFSGAGKLDVTGTGTLDLTNGTNTYSGGTDIYGATVQIAAPGNIGTGEIGIGKGSQSGTLELLAGFASQTLPNDIHVHGVGGTIQLDVPAVNNPVLGGNIKGSEGSLTFNQTNASTLTLSGINIYSGTMVLQNPLGTLQIGSTTGLLFSNLVNNGSLVFAQSGAALVAGSITGPGSMTIQGGAGVDLVGNSTFTGPTTVLSGGGLFVDGSSTGSPITVQGGGFLAGAGTVQNATINTGAFILPGDDAPGTLSGNNFTLQSGSVFVSFLGNAAAGEINAAGTLTIAPNSLLNISPQGAVTPQVTHYTLASAASIVGPQFILTSPLPSFILEILYSPTLIELLVLAPPFQNLLPDGNPKNTAVCFQTVMQLAPPDLIELNKILDLQTPAQLQHSFNQMQPANFDDIAYAGENVGERIRQIFTSHFFEQRAVSCADRKGWRLWTAPFVTKAVQNGEELFSSYKERFVGVTTAADYHKKMWMFSGGFSYATTEMTMPGGKARANFNTYAGTLGATWSNNRWFTDIQFAYQYSPIHAHRKMFFIVDTPLLSGSEKRHAHHYDRSNQVMGHFGGGYDIKVPAGRNGSFNFYPFANVDYFYDLQSGYKEKGAESLNLKVHGKQYDFLRPEAGLGLGYHGCFKTMDIWFDMSASYVLEFRLIGRDTHVNFKKSSCEFEVRGLNPQNNLICPEARIKVASPINGFALSLGYHGEFGEHFMENSGQAELRKAF
ncbi:MAG: hypothetical protein JSS60_08185 [Verrucomicrobia bacterium]|nr:hypothetical protein [Verrucomicrobiota bacterium]